MAVDQVVALPAAQPHGVRARLGHVGAEHRREHRLRRGRPPRAGEKLLHLAQHQVGVAEVRPVVDRVELEHSRAGDVVGKVPAGLERGHLVLVGVDHQRRHPDRRQDAADVDLNVHAHEILGIARARAHLRELAPPRCDLRVLELARRVRLHAQALAPGFADAGDPLVELAGGDAPRITRPQQARRIAAVDDQPSRAIRVRGREKGRHHTPF